MRTPLPLLALALAACGSSTDTDTTTLSTGDGSVTITTARDGDTTTMVAKGAGGETVTTSIDPGGSSWPADAPAHAPAYPGAKVTGVMKSVGNGVIGRRLTFETTDAPANVVAFYKSRADKAGLPELATMTNDTMGLYSAGAERGAAVIIQASRNEGKTVALLTFSNGGVGR